MSKTLAIRQLVNRGTYLGYGPDGKLCHGVYNHALHCFYFLGYHDQKVIICAFHPDATERQSQFRPIEQVGNLPVDIVMSASSSIICEKCLRPVNYSDQKGRWYHNIEPQDRHNTTVISTRNIPFINYLSDLET